MVRPGREVAAIAGDRGGCGGSGGRQERTGTPWGEWRPAATGHRGSVLTYLAREPGGFGELTSAKQRPAMACILPTRPPAAGGELERRERRLRRGGEPWL
jgi:hypothetical protein